MLFEPWDHNTGIQAARIGTNDFFVFGLRGTHRFSPLFALPKQGAAIVFRATLIALKTKTLQVERKKTFKIRLKGQEVEN